MTFKIEVGKYYINLLGDVVGPIVEREFTSKILKYPDYKFMEQVYGSIYLENGCSWSGNSLLKEVTKDGGSIVTSTEWVNNPDHYGGSENPYEVIKVIRAWGLGFSLGNAVKYVARAGKKNPKKTIEDLEKAIWYIQEEVNTLKKDSDNA